MKTWTLTHTGFVEVNVTQEMRDAADKRDKSFYNRLGNVGTHRTDKGRQRTTGYLAEAAVASVFPRLEYSKDPNIDFIFKDITFDVKAQGCNSMPSPTFVGTLYEEQSSREVDFYIFTRVKNDFTKVWITGFVSKKQFLSTAKLIPVGAVNNNFRYDQARYEIEYRLLTKPQQFMGPKT